MTALADLQKAFHVYFGESSNIDTNTWSDDTDVNRFLNTAYDELHDYSIMVGSMFSLSTSLLSYVADTKEYTLATKRIVHMEGGWESGKGDANRFEIYPLDRPMLHTRLPYLNSNNSNNGTSAACWYHADSDKIGIVPTPSTSLTENVKVWHFPAITAMAAADSTPSLLPAHFHDLVAQLAALKALVVVNKPASDAAAMYKERLDDMKRMLRKHVQTTTRIKSSDSNRRFGLDLSYRE